MARYDTDMVTQGKTRNGRDQPSGRRRRLPPVVTPFQLLSLLLAKACPPDLLVNPLPLLKASLPDSQHLHRSRYGRKDG